MREVFRMDARDSRQSRFFWAEAWSRFRKRVGLSDDADRRVFLESSPVFRFAYCLLFAKAVYPPFHRYCSASFAFQTVLVRAPCNGPSFRPERKKLRNRQMLESGRKAKSLTQGIFNQQISCVYLHYLHYIYCVSRIIYSLSFRGWLPISICRLINTRIMYRESNCAVRVPEAACDCAW